MTLADLNGGEVEGILVCLIVVALVAAAVWFVCGQLLAQAWAPTAAAIVFLLGALFCLL